MTAFADLTSPGVAELLTADRIPVLLLPVGSVEPHGPHAPLSTDTIISAGMCERVATRLADDPHVRVLILPGLPYGVTRYGAPFAGAISVSEDSLHAMVVDICTSLVDQGFRWLVLVNNHFEPENVTALRRAITTVGLDTVSYVNVLRRANAARLTKEFRSGACHAGQYETSLVLADHPSLVDTAVMRELPALHVDMVKAVQSGRSDFLLMGMDRAYCGAPADATAEEGRSTFDVLTDMLIEEVRKVAGRP